MKAAIVCLEEYLYVLENNEPINRREGNIEQAVLEMDSAIDIRKALSVLRATDVNAVTA